MEEKVVAKAIWKGMSSKVYIIVGLIYSFILFLVGFGIEPEIFYIVFIMIAFLWGFIGLLWYIIKKFSYVELVVTENRIYGYTSRNNRVDLPVSKISSVGLSWGNSITISTPSGVLCFRGIINRDNVYNAIISLINETENNQQNNTLTQQNLHTTDELKKYKELLDTGVISQEEFDAKKKQLLGL